ncbi:helix-turn-helix domain-containing protein [Paraburkholderia sp. GAS41]|uniref:helix-turn-helix domain-containing protein n=1 Tax=Paraburkholderia sp. GAS41 TaxID=3035134 RepID=UPI003D1EEDD2
MRMSLFEGPYERELPNGRHCRVALAGSHFLTSASHRPPTTRTVVAKPWLEPRTAIRWESTRRYLRQTLQARPSSRYILHIIDCSLIECILRHCSYLNLVSNQSLRAGLGRALRAARRYKNVSQESMGATSRTYLSALERGLQSPTLDKLESIANDIGIHPLTLFIYAYTAGSTDVEIQRIQSRIQREIEEIVRYDLNAQ